MIKLLIYKLPHGSSFQTRLENLFLILPSVQHVHQIKNYSTYARVDLKRNESASHKISHRQQFAKRLVWPFDII